MTEEEMDNFVLAVVPKKTATKMQKELLDLVGLCVYCVNATGGTHWIKNYLINKIQNNSVNVYLIQLIHEVI